MIKEFKQKLKQTNLSVNTIESYLRSIKQYDELYNKINKTNLLAYKSYLIETYKPKTVNLRIQAINKYLEFNKLEQLKLKYIKVQQRTFLENVISDADYKFFKSKLKKDKRMNWYFVVRYLAATGARISELIQIKVEHIYAGFLDLYGKGSKVRRIYIPKALREETIIWLDNSKYKSGYFFLNHFGERISSRGIAFQLKAFAKEYGINQNVVYPHSFRHRFAKNFLEKHNDISLLADLMGHDSIETTRIYLRKTATEQQELVDKVVTW